MSEQPQPSPDLIARLEAIAADDSLESARADFHRDMPNSSVVPHSHGLEWVQHLAGDVLRAIALLRVAPATADRGTAYPCSACGAIAYCDLLDSVDSGTTLTCDTCGGKTVVELRPSPRVVPTETR